MIKADLDVPIEVTQNQYYEMIYFLSGIIAHRTENGRFWIKRLWPTHRKEVEAILNQ